MTRARLWLSLARTAVAAAVLAPFFFWKGGLLELESLQFIKQYLDGRSPIRKIFDPYTNDFKTYQARELSYFIDYIDAHVFKRLMAMDLTIFVPLSAVVASILTVVVVLVATRRYRTLSRLTATLLLLMFLTNFIEMITMAFFYRSSKPLLSPVVMAATFFLAAIFDGGAKDAVLTRRTRWLQALAIFGLFSLMSLLDRQGFFLALLGLVLVAGHAIRIRGRWELIAAGAVAIGCMHLYNVAIGPAIVHAVSGYVPSRAYQDVPREELFGGIAIYGHAVEVMANSVQVLFGGLPGVLSMLLLAVIGVQVVRRSGPWIAASLALLSIAGFQIVLLAGMIARLPAVYEWDDHRFFYYPLPTQALTFALLVVLLARLVAGWSAWRVTALNTIVVLIVVSNVLHWHGDRERMRVSRWFPRIYTQNVLLKESIRNGQPAPGLIPQYREFFELCVGLSPRLQERRATSAVPQPREAAR